MAIYLNNFLAYIRTQISRLFDVLFKPKSNNGDVARIEFILNTMLMMSIALVALAATSVIYNYLTLAGEYKGNSPLFIISIGLLFCCLLWLSRNGYIKVASIGMVSLFFLAISHGIYYAGADQPQTLLSYTIIIAMSGMLLGARFAFFTTALIVGTIIFIGWLQIGGVYQVSSYWKNEAVSKADLIFFSLTFIILSIISWLSNREIEKSLARARSAEKELRKERDLLEVKVKERTAEIEELQFEKTKQMQNFVEFGRNASGLFHDMVNPVQAAILALHNLRKNAPINDRVGLDNSIDEVVSQMERARKIISAARNQITRQDINIMFDPEEQIAFVFQMLAFKARHAGVKLVYSLSGEQHMLIGNPLSFHRLISGLVSNAIDSYDCDILKTEKQKTVTVTSENSDGCMILSVSDNGNGIKKENQNKIFELFFTTKGIEKGTGIGLSICKEIAEKEFGGEIAFNSEEGNGTTFIVKLPLRKLETK